MAKYQSTLTGPQMDAALAAMPDAEAYARGTRNGQEVQEGDPTYHNNSKYYAQLAQSAFPESYATGAVRGDIDQSTQTEEWRAQARENIGITNPEWGNITGNISSQADLAEVVSPLINQWDEQWELGDINYTEGASIPSTTRIRTKNYIPVVGGTTLFYKVPNTINVFYYDENKNYLGNTVGVGRDSVSANSAKILPQNARYIRAEFTPTYGTTYNHDISINYPYSYTGYYPSKLSKVDMPWADLLWENASPTSAFAAQTVSVPSANYSTFYIEFGRMTTDPGNNPTCLVEKGKARDFALPIRGVITLRNVSNSANQDVLSFGNANKYETYGSSTQTQDNTLLIPLRIYGIR